jgi:transposase
MDAGYGCFHLANPSAIKQYEGLKHSEDQHDVFFLAQLQILGILPQGYIYPKPDRPVRDLGRKRLLLVHHKTSHILSFQSLITRCCGQRISSNQIRTLTGADLAQWLKEEHLLLSAQANLDSIAFLKQQIYRLEKTIHKKLKRNKAFECLLTVPGIGKILAMTIMLEVGDISRFAKVGNFASYCRYVSLQRLSEGKTKGSGNGKNGNRYLSWAFTEAAQLGRRFNAQFRSYYDRKAAQTNTIVAIRALSNKIARICYYIIRDQVGFNPKLCDTTPWTWQGTDSFLGSANPTRGRKEKGKWLTISFIGLDLDGCLVADQRRVRTTTFGKPAADK